MVTLSAADTAATSYFNAVLAERHTVASSLRKMRDNFLGAIVTMAFSYAAYNAAEFAVLQVSLLPCDMEHRPPPLLLCGLVFLSVACVLVGMPLLFYLRLARRVAVVASVAEPGLRGKGAVARACRLVRGNKAQDAACLLAGAVVPACMLAVGLSPLSAPSGDVGIAAFAGYLLLTAAKDVVVAAAVAAYYFECKKKSGEEGKAGHKE